MGAQIPRYLLLLARKITSPASGNFEVVKQQQQGDFDSNTTGHFLGIVATNTLSHALKSKHEIKTEK